MIKSSLKNMYSKVMKYAHEYKWKSQIKNNCIVLDKTCAIMDEINLEKDEKILIVVPHPDDEIIGCYNIMCKYGQNVIAFYSGMTGDDKTPINKKIRSREFVKLCQEFNAEYILARENWCDELMQIMLRKDIKYVFIPSVIDWHREHREIYINTVKLIKKLENPPMVFCYQVTVPIPEKYINCHFLMKKEECERKWKIFEKIYVSQQFMPVKRFKVAENAYIKENVKLFAEVYMKLDEKKMECSSAINIRDERYDNMRYDINNLKKIRDIAEIEYEAAYQKA